MTSTITTERERQRVEHLVLGRPRPEPVIGGRPKGLSRLEWKVRKEQLRDLGATLLPGIDERVRLVEEHGGGRGTAETVAHLAVRQARPGAIARLFKSGAIDADQLAAADKIADTYRAVTADAPFRTASWETRTGGGGGPGDAELVPLGAALGEYALDWWLRSIRQPEAMLAIVARDVALTVAARRHALSVPKARDLVRAGLDTWWRRYGRGEVVAS